MELEMRFLIDEDGYPVRYGESDLRKMTSAQRETYEAMRWRYHHIQTALMQKQRAKEARTTQKLIESDPQLAAEVEAKARSA